MTSFRKNMQAKYRKEQRFSGEQRFRGVVVGEHNGVKNTVACDHTRGAKDDAMADARKLLAYLQTSEWTT